MSLADDAAAYDQAHPEVTVAGRFTRNRLGQIQSSEPLEARFWRNVDKSGDCWLWTGCVRGGKPPRPAFYYTPLRRMEYAYRVSYLLTKGEITRGRQVCHRCDNPLCVRPGHLFLGTQADNVADMMQKGRASVGERHYAAKLTDDQVRAIMAATGSCRAIGEAFGVSEMTASRIRRGQAWKHITVAAPAVTCASAMDAAPSRQMELGV